MAEKQTARPSPSSGVQNLAPYSPGLSIAEIQDKYGLQNVIKLASNENPLGVSPLAAEALIAAAKSAFRYPQSGNPRLVAALAEKHGVDPRQIIVGNGSDELLDLLVRVFASGKSQNIVCFTPCFSIYPIQAMINGNELRRVPLNDDFTFNFQALLDRVDENTALVFLTTPDNPSGFCPAKEEVRNFLQKLSKKAPAALAVIDEAYMDFADEGSQSLLAEKSLPANAVFSRTFSKSYGLAGMRVGYLVTPPGVAGWLWRARLPFSVNILAEEAALAALKDETFRAETLRVTAEGREYLTRELKKSGCKVWPSSANFIMFSLPETAPAASVVHEQLLKKGIIIRRLDSYGLPDNLRVTVGNGKENRIFISALRQILAAGPCDG